MNVPLQALRVAVTALILTLDLIGTTAHADGNRRVSAVPLLPAYRQECASCHVAYPPGMLPAASWQRLLGGLPRHFGTDASLDPATVQALSVWLTANAGTYKRVRDAPPQDRITTSAWFTRQHDEIPSAIWKRASIKSPANCSACHVQADQGNFDEHDVRIPAR